MTKKRPIEWTKLDNAAKIFPPTTNERDTKVFRFVCELKEEIKKDILQEALDKALIHFPFYKSVLRKGVFWYYFESTDLQPIVKEDYKSPCSTLYYPNQKTLLFEVTYYKRRINLEVYHALTDGTGALAFLKTLLFYYIKERYQEDFSNKIPKLDYDASMSQKMDDSFLKHYTGLKSIKRVKINKAYQVVGRRTLGNQLKVIEGTMPVKDVLTLAHQHHTTLTIYLTSLFLYAISKEMSERSKKYPVVLTIPVNLRSYFPSATARNFFGTINIKYYFNNENISFEDIIQKVKEEFDKELTPEKVKEHMNRLAALEHNVFARIVPLGLKDVVLKIANRINDKGITATLSNIGKITMPEEYMPYIELFNCFTSARRPQICMCSFQNQLVVSFASPFVSSDIQKNFFRELSHQGIPVTIGSNGNSQAQD